jgi:hypothetical protein
MRGESIRHQLVLASAILHSIAVTRLTNTVSSQYNADYQRQNYKRRLKIHQDKAVPDKAKIFRLIKQSKARVVRLSQKIDYLIAEAQRKDKLIAQLLAED